MLLADLNTGEYTDSEQMVSPNTLCPKYTDSKQIVSRPLSLGLPKSH